MGLDYQASFFQVDFKLNLKFNRTYLEAVLRLSLIDREVLERLIYLMRTSINYKNT